VRRANAPVALDDGKSVRQVRGFPYPGPDTVRGWLRGFRRAGPGPVDPTACLERERKLTRARETSPVAAGGSARKVRSSSASIYTIVPQAPGQLAVGSPGHGRRQDLTGRKVAGRRLRRRLSMVRPSRVRPAAERMYPWPSPASVRAHPFPFRAPHSQVQPGRDGQSPCGFGPSPGQSLSGRARTGRVPPSSGVSTGSLLSCRPTFRRGIGRGDRHPSPRR